MDRGTLIVRQGKGKRDRMIPIGPRAIIWTGRYLDDVRPHLVVEPDDGTLFLTVDGTPFAPSRLTQLVRVYVNRAAIGKTGSCHLFRHTMATLMLEGGADTRYIQQMLGHARLETTQIYTQVSIRQLQAIYLATHPGATNEHHRRPDEEDEDPSRARPAASSSLAASAATPTDRDDEPHGDPDEDLDGSADSGGHDPAA
ncbi:MAG: tyrosine-type recombinase/integrase [Nitriliruptorales bacterium]